MITPAYREVPLSSITPKGWLQTLLENQRDGLTGHLEVAGKPFGVLGWKYDTDERSKIVWEPYEQDGYWVDGMVRTALLLNDDTFLAKARESIDFVLENADEDGYLGHPHLKELAPPEETWSYARRRRWAHAVFFRAFMADGMEEDRKERLVQALERHYVNTDYPHVELREVCNVEIMLWVYQQTGNTKLLDMAVSDYKEFNAKYADEVASLKALTSDEKPVGHGVTYNEMAKLGAVLYRFTGDEELLAASIKGYEKLEDYQVLVDGVCSSSEHLRGKDPLDSHEICDISDQTWSQGYLLLATGDCKWADRIERACLNAGPGAVTDDFRALQYFSCPNQVVADAESNHNKQFCGKHHMSYRPRPGTPCCPGNVHRYMPNYGARMWMHKDDGRLMKVFYGASEFVTEVGDKQVRIEEQTDFPFSADVELTIHTEGRIDLSLGLRIPGWAQGATIAINGEHIEANLDSCQFYHLDRTFTDGDTIQLFFPQHITSTNWPGGGIALERGPLVYSLPVSADKQVDPKDPNQTEDFPAWNMYPTSHWAYGLGSDSAEKAEVVERNASGYMYSVEGAPLILRVPASRLKGWDIERHSELVDENKGADDIQAHREVRKGNFQFTPTLPDPNKIAGMVDGEEVIDLVPYGCTTLRMTIFPEVTI